MTENTNNIKEMTAEERALRLTVVASTQSVMLHSLLQLLNKFSEGPPEFREFFEKNNAHFKSIEEEMKSLLIQLNESIGIENE